MMRNFGRGVVVALLLSAGCEDTRMDLLPPPPPAAAGTAGGAMAGMAGNTLGGDGGAGGLAGRAAIGGTGGRGASGGGGFGAVAGTSDGVPCAPGTYPPGTHCCKENPDCSPDVPFCSYGRCVECLPEQFDQPQDGCTGDNICDPTVNVCIPPCTTNDDCGSQGFCDHERNLCVQCTVDDHCKNNRLSKHCQTQFGICVECTASSQCDQEHPICGTSGVAWSSCVECTSSKDCTKDPTWGVCSFSDQLPNVCVQCTRSEDKVCEDKGQTCNEAVGSCVDCVTSQQCKYPTPFCRQDNRCVECLSVEHCTDKEAPFCRDGQCDAQP